MTVRPITATRINILSWNANGLANKLEELNAFAQEQTYDLILIQESHLKQNSPNCKIPNYVLYRTDRTLESTNRASGGTAIYVKRCLDHSLIPLPDLQQLEATCIAINTSMFGLINIFSCYIKPGTLLNLQDLETTLNNNKNPSILMGDFNSKCTRWNSNTTNSKGSKLSEYTLKNNITVIRPNEPTIFPFSGGRPDVIDIALLHKINNYIEIKAIVVLSSDHNPISLELVDEDIIANDPISSAINWETFTEEIKKTICPIPVIDTIQSLELAVDTFTSKIQAAMKKASSRFPRSKLHRPALDQTTRTYIAKRRVIRKQWHLHRDPADKKIYNNLTTKIRDSLREAKNIKWKNFLTEINPEEPLLWKISKTLRNPHTPCIVYTE